MGLSYEDLPDEIHQRIARLEVEMHDLQFELKMHRFVALIVFGALLERAGRWVLG